MHRRLRRRLTGALCLLASLTACDAPAPALHPSPPTTSAAASPVAAPGPCVLGSSELPLLGQPGDSPIVPVRVAGRAAAMFFSPGFAPVLFSRNGPASFERFSPHPLRTQEGELVLAWLARARQLQIGDMDATDEMGLLLARPETRVVDGRPLVGMLGRAILKQDAVISLDVPDRQVIVSVPRSPTCLDLAGTMQSRPIAMGEELLEIPVRIDGHRVQAVLDPDLPMSVLPADLAGEVGIGADALAGDPEVRTQFGRGVLGHRHRVRTLEVGDARLADFTFDVERHVNYVMLGLNFFGRGIAVFDRRNGAFYFRETRSVAPRSTALHFDTTRVVHVNVQE